MTNSEPMKMDAVILAGTHRNTKRLIYGQNKAFLTIQGQPMIKYVVQQAMATQRLGSIIVVGPRTDLEQSLAEEIRSGSVRVVQQRSRMLENVWTGFLATFPDGNPLPQNREIETLLLGGHLPIRKKKHLYIFKAVYASLACQMHKERTRLLPRDTVIAAMDRRFDGFRRRNERAEWFMGRIGIDTILRDGHIIQETADGVKFTSDRFYDFFFEYETRLQKKIFVTSCDLPLIVPEAIDDFIRRSGQYRHDFIFSVSTDQQLSHFYSGAEGSPGIIRPYMWLREAKIRAANLIVVRPNWIGNKNLIQESFGIRKMTEWRNILSLIGKLLYQRQRWRSVRLAVLLQLIAVLHRNGFERAAELLRRRAWGRELEESLSRLFFTHFKLLVTPYAGVSLDVDSQEDYEILVANQEYWLTVQSRLVESLAKKNVHVFNR